MKKINKNMMKYTLKNYENVRRTWQRYMGGQCMMGAISAAREGRASHYLSCWGEGHGMMIIFIDMINTLINIIIIIIKQ